MVGDDASAVRRFAVDLRDASERLIAELGDGPDMPAPGTVLLTTVDQLRSELIATVPGSMQKAVLGLAGLYTEEGMTTEEARRALGLGEPAQAFQPLQRLRARGDVEEIPDVKPKRWRIAERHRRRLREDG